MLTQPLYCLYLCWKCMIQLPSDLRVSGASLRQMLGICPLKRERATSSNSLDMPTSPAKAFKQKNKYIPCVFHIIINNIIKEFDLMNKKNRNKLLFITHFRSALEFDLMNK